MSLYKTIVVAVDFSPAAETVTRRAMDVAERCGAALELVHVVEYLPPLDIGYEPVTAPEWSVDEQVLIDNARKSLEDLAERQGMGDVPRHVELGAPKQVIVRVARERNADLIVIGSHGRHGIGRLLGSTADGVLHHAACDVLAVRIQD